MKNSRNNFGSIYDKENKRVIFLNQIVVFGGQSGNNFLNKIEYFDILSQNWFSIPLKMKRNNAFFSFVKLDDYRVLIIGGHDGEKYLKSVYEIDLEHETIQDYEDLKTERFF